MESAHSIETPHVAAVNIEATVDTCQIFDASPADAQVNVDATTASITAENMVGDNVIEAAESMVETPQATATATTAVNAAASMVGSDDRVSKKDLVSLLEGFVRIIKTDDVTAADRAAHVPGTGIELAQGGMVTTEAHIDDRTVEIDQLRNLVIEAQDTIIKLLTDRVEDRSKIATLEAQLSLLPDLQAQADRAMSVAIKTEDYRTELTKMKFELDRFRLFRVRIEAENKKGSVFNRIQKWLFSRPNAADDTMQRHN